MTAIKDAVAAMAVPAAYVGAVTVATAAAWAAWRALRAAARRIARSFAKANDTVAWARSTAAADDEEADAMDRHLDACEIEDLEWLYHQPSYQREEQP
ncbi:hypothetical protein ABZ312_11620 [Streptomyces sp. NPDC006207]